jgi:hypothetical protein
LPNACHLRREMAVASDTRVDGRSTREVRPIEISTSFLPPESVHGSAVFTRGETQSLATVTLGDKGSRQRSDTLDGEQSKQFYLQYVFPPSSVGECGRVGTPGRREIGHGNLAERGLRPVIPSESEFPYTIRVESLITGEFPPMPVSCERLCASTHVFYDSARKNYTTFDLKRSFVFPIRNRRVVRELQHGICLLRHARHA